MRPFRDGLFFWEEVAVSGGVRQDGSSGGQKMKTERWSLCGVTLLLAGLLPLSASVVGQELGQEARSRRGTVQSELDYLRAAKLPISIELTQVTIRQAYDGIARAAELGIAYEGAMNGDSKHDLSFKGMSLKEILGELGEKFKLTYRVDGPDRLTVIGAKSK